MLKKYQCLIPLIIFFTTTVLSDTVQHAVHSGKYPEYPQVNYGTGKQAELIKLGEYLVRAGDCIACHTAEINGQPFAGGLPIKTPFGTMYSTNITPDKTTGIGAWSDEEFVRALREGISPHGSYYFPVFPYIYFNKLTNEDALAIRAYLNAIPAVQQQNRKPDMPWPFSWRFGQIAWRALFFEPNKGMYQPDKRKSAAWNRGKYLVTGLGHCGMCHTPLNFLGAEKKPYFLTGGFVSGFYAPNITSTGLTNTPVQDVVNVFLKDKLIGGGDVQGPMLEVNHDSLFYLNRADLDAIVEYLKTVKSKTPPKPKRSGEVNLKVGEDIYNTYCTGCHTTGAGGAPKIGDNAAWAPLIKTGLNQLYKNAMSGIGGMPAKGTCGSCSLIEIQSAVDYIVSKSGGTAAVGAAPSSAAQIPAKPTYLVKGKEVYDRVCSICHNEGQLNAPKIGDKTTWQPILNENSMDVLISRAINGYKNHPARGSCYDCSDADIIAATVYMVQQSKEEGDYELWGILKSLTSYFPLSLAITSHARMRGAGIVF